VYPYTGTGRKGSTPELVNPVSKQQLSSSINNSATTSPHRPVAHGQNFTIDELLRHRFTATTAAVQELQQGREPPRREKKKFS
jgi:hypothetical protein